MSYGAALSDLFRRSTRYVHRILQGAKPAEQPIEQTTQNRRRRPCATNRL